MIFQPRNDIFKEIIFEEKSLAEQAAMDGRFWIIPILAIASILLIVLGRTQFVGSEFGNFGGFEWVRSSILVGEPGFERVRSSD